MAGRLRTAHCSSSSSLLSFRSGSIQRRKDQLLETPIHFPFGAKRVPSSPVACWFRPMRLLVLGKPEHSPRAHMQSRIHQSEEPRTRHAQSTARSHTQTAGTHAQTHTVARRNTNTTCAEHSASRIHAVRTHAGTRHSPLKHVHGMCRRFHDRWHWPRRPRALPQGGERRVQCHRHFKARVSTWEAMCRPFRS